jgi:uncharacterized ubiquitin-like protein YukD
MKKITFDFTPYVLGSYDVYVARYNDKDEIISQTIFVAHKIDGKIIFENFDVGSYELNDAEINYIETILLNS